jgi:hypothetical protein
MSLNNEKLARIIAATAIATVDDVISVLRNLDRELSSNDGLKWFNLLYLRVTEGVRNQSATIRWENSKWLERLDVIFAKLYFAGIANWQNGRISVARSWSPLFESRDQGASCVCNSRSLESTRISITTCPSLSFKLAKNCASL